jgi:uncharacterized protein DUF5916
MRMPRPSCLLALLAIAPAIAAAETVPATVRAHAIRRTGSISIDGNLDEPAWAAAPKQSGFTQRFPKDGAKASYETRFAILYDDEAIYVGVWADDPDPRQIRRLLTRRDVDSPADAIAVGIDSYHDRRTAYVFQLNAAGVQRDMLLFDDSNMDDTWDAVWTGDVSITDKGWTAEFRIPLNQLRFGENETHEWGLQVMRTVSRTQEQASWSPWPRSASDTVSKFGVVDGIDHVRPGRRLELLPYATGGFQQQPVDAGDPLNNTYKGNGNVGLDLKYGLGPAFTLSATINPDFGQVEADPSQVNLSGNELFFAEKRPFFLEGVDLFKLPIGPGDNPIEGAFYSRRIGAPAPGLPDNYTYIAAPASTRIYSAAKLTGKTRDGWSIGALDAVTGSQTADVVDGDGMMTHPTVAPLTNYLIARVKRDLREGKTSVGASATAVHRKLDGTGLEGLLHDQAYSLGTQLEHRWAKNAWYLNLHTVGSVVHGSEDAIARTQTAQRHLFQRPDRTDQHFDPTRTSLTGGGITWQAGKLGDTKHWRFGYGGDIQTSGLELNDMGFQNGSDRILSYLWGQYHDEDPGDDVLNWQWNTDVFHVNNFEKLADVGIEWNGNVQLANYWSFGTGGNYESNHWAFGALRGGPALRGTPHIFSWLNVNTDSRKSVRVSVNARVGRAPESDEIDNGFDLGVQIQAASNIDIFLGPSWSYNNDPMQYVAEAADATGKPHYIFAHIDQKSVGVTTRVNWTFSPKLSLQAYAQPFIATGRYSEYKDVNNPGADRFRDRFTLIDANAHLSDGVFTVNQQGMYSFGRPDFSFRQLRSNVVLRWEYRPGSSLFAIWSHGQTNSTDDGRFRLGDDLRGLASADQENLVMVKANYWIGL